MSRFKLAAQRLRRNKSSDAKKTRGERRGANGNCENKVRTCCAANVCATLAPRFFVTSLFGFCVASFAPQVLSPHSFKFLFGDKIQIYEATGEQGLRV